MLYVSVFVVAALGLVVAEGPSDSPMCSDTIDTALKKTFPDPVPEDLLEETSKLGPMSVLTLAAPSLKQLQRDEEACSRVIINKDKKTATSLRKMVPGVLPQSLNIVEKGDKFDLTGINNPQISFTVYALYLKDGVSVIAKCCKDCKGDGINIAVAVADKKKDEAATKTAISDVKKKLNSIKLDIPDADLNACIGKEVYDIIK